MKPSHTIHFRVKYSETDAQGFVHHSNYLNYFEAGRVELLRSQKCNYRELEETGLFLVVVKMECQYKVPALFDDLLTLNTTLLSSKGASLEHGYELFREEELLVVGKSLVGCVDSKGKVRRIPEDILKQIIQ